MHERMDYLISLLRRSSKVEFTIDKDVYQLMEDVQEAWDYLCLHDLDTNSLKIHKPDTDEIVIKVEMKD